MNYAQMFLAAKLFVDKYRGIPLKSVQNIPSGICVDIIEHDIRNAKLYTIKEFLEYFNITLEDTV